MNKRCQILITAAAVLCFLTTSAFTDDNRPVSLFDRATLSGWHSSGPASWRVENGAITGSAKAGAGGWLVLDKTYEDFLLTFSFQCNGCDTGLLFRNVKAADGTGSGIYIPFTGATAGQVFRVSLDARGNETTRTPLESSLPPLRPGGTLTKGSCSPIPCDGIVGAHGGESFGFGRVAAPIKLDPAGWNTFQITVRGEAMPGLINGTALTLAKMDQGRRYGEIALKIGSGDVRVKDIRMMDFIERPSVLPTEYTNPQFKKIQVSDLFYSEGIAAGDFNHDGFQDVVSGPFIYYGPDFTKSSELFPPYPLAPAGHPEPGEEQPQAGMIVHGAYSNTFISFVYDFNNDGWPDVLQVMGFGPRPTFSGHLFINPKGASRHWENYNVAPLITTEINQFVDVDGDGKPELVSELATTPNWTDNQEGYLKVDWSDPTKPWTFHPISEKGTWGGHGAGVGDINGDGRMDILAAFGWWEQPPAGVTGLWKYHEQRFGREGTNCGPGCGGSEMLVYDVNNDGLPDVITSLAAHGAGLGWFEQKRDGSGGISWVKHTIMGDPNDTPEQRQLWEETDKNVAFTELHALAFADMDGDGVTDIVTGKRWLSHGYTYQENDRDSPAVVYWFRTVRKPGGKVEFEPHMIHNNSGVGTFMAAVDVNGDGAPDVLTTARKGTFIFLNNMRKR